LIFMLVIHDKPPYPDGKYLIKGGGREVWKRFRLRKEHRRLQGIIHGKRCGTTENIEPAERVRWSHRLCERGGDSGASAWLNATAQTRCRNAE
jgi:hypothetical protein